MHPPVTLICTPLRFHVGSDEDIFFEWLKRIPAVKNFKGIGKELHLCIESNTIPDEDLLDLMGLFKRYKFDTHQLQVFMNHKNKHWFE